VVEFEFVAVVLAVVDAVEVSESDCCGDGGGGDVARCIDEAAAFSSRCQAVREAPTAAKAKSV
jgi:hypothetical protein